MGDRQLLWQWRTASMLVVVALCAISGCVGTGASTLSNGNSGLGSGVGHGQWGPDDDTRLIASTDDERGAGKYEVADACKRTQDLINVLERAGIITVPPGREVGLYVKPDVNVIDNLVRCFQKYENLRESGLPVSAETCERLLACSGNQQCAGSGACWLLLQTARDAGETGPTMPSALMSERQTQPQDIPPHPQGFPGVSADVNARPQYFEQSGVVPGTVQEVPSSGALSPTKPDGPVGVASGLISPASAGDGHGATEAENEGSKPVVKPFAGEQDTSTAFDRPTLAPTEAVEDNAGGQVDPDVQLQLAVVPAPTSLLVRPPMLGAKVLGVETYKCSIEDGDWVQFYVGSLQNDVKEKIALTVSERYALRRYRDEVGVDRTDWWCIPRRRYCYRQIKMTDYGATLSVGASFSAASDNVRTLPESGGIESAVEAFLKEHCP